MWLLKLLITLVLLYGAIVAAAYFTQSRVLFPTRVAASAGPMPASTKRLALITPTGRTLSGVHIPGQFSQADRPLILGFAGNAWNADDAAAYLHGLYRGADIVTFHYRGYSPSEGSPSAEALKADALLIHDFVRRNYNNAQIIVVGFSIGSGVAASLAAHRPVDGIILVSPFDSLTAVASSHFPWLPVRLLFRHRMEAAADLRSVQAPVAVISGERDSIIPSARTDALKRALPSLVFARTVSGADHNDIYQDPAFHSAMQDALVQVLAHTKAST